MAKKGARHIVVQRLLTVLVETMERVSGAKKTASTSFGTISRLSRRRDSMPRFIRIMMYITSIAIATIMLGGAVFVVYLLYHVFGG